MKIDLALAIACVFSVELVWIMGNILRENKRMLFSRIGKAKVVKCEICSYVYFVSSQITYSKCPVCSSINKFN